MAKKLHAEVLLPAEVKPSHYVVTLSPNPGFFTGGDEPDEKLFIYNGKCEISLDVAKPVKEIKCHGHDIKITTASIRAEGSKDEMAIKAPDDPDEKEQVITFALPEEIKAGKYVLTCDFTGILNDKLCGFYRSNYKGSDGKTRWIATTQFEATDARRAMPCWDEPNLKALFEVKLVVPEGYQAVSNMHCTCMETIEEGLMKYHYAPTPKMSSYLMAVIIGKFDYVGGFTKNRGTEIRVYTQPGKSSKGHFALDLAIRALEFYEEYFDVPYPLPKMDLLAIPDFAAGAMENWGAVTYREIRLLADEKTSLDTKIQIGRTVCHELAHMWFGNLVTMDWWTYLWLNEGFAQFMEHFSLDAVEPTWRVWDTQFGGVSRRGLSLDALATSHPVEVPVKHPDEVNEIFDAISYSKGSAIVRQVYCWIGPEAFRKGISSYLKKFAYGNTQTADLWDELGASTPNPKELPKMMEKWVQTTGYPVLTADLASESDGKLEIKITQQRYFASGLQKDNDQLWIVPIHSVSKGGKTFKQKYEGRSGTITVPASKGDWVKLNAGQVGFYRVQYGPKLRERLGKALQSGELDEADRLGILNDTKALCDAGILPVTDMLELLKSYAKEEAKSVLDVISSVFGGLLSLHEGEKYEQDIKKLQRAVFKRMWDKLGWEAKPNEDPNASVIRDICLMKQSSDPKIQKKCIQMVEDEFKECADGSCNIDPAIRRTVYFTASRYGPPSIAKGMREMWQKTNRSDAQVFRERLGALHRVKTKEQILDAIQFFKKNVKPTNSYICYAHLGMTALGSDILWEELNTNWKWFEEQFCSGGQSWLSSYNIKFCCENFRTMEKHAAVKKFFEEHPVSGAKRAVDQSLEKIATRAKNLERQRPVLQKYFALSIEE